MSQWWFFFILASSKLTLGNIYKKDNFGSVAGPRSQIISAPPAPTPAPQHCKKTRLCDTELIFLQYLLSKLKTLAQITIEKLPLSLHNYAEALMNVMARIINAKQYR